MSSPVEQIGKVILVTGLLVAMIGLILVLSGKISWIGRLPGDILIKKKNFTFYFPLATSILLSILLSLILYLLGKR
jgi:hypothetical protein